VNSNCVLLKVGVYFNHITKLLKVIELSKGVSKHGYRLELGNGWLSLVKDVSVLISVCSGLKGTLDHY